MRKSPSKISGYAKQLVAEIVGDQRLQADGVFEVKATRRADATPEAGLSERPLQIEPQPNVKGSR